jgi:hypothetical protein
MTRLKAWTGSRWSDVMVWTGTAWKGYTDYVYGANAFEDYMDTNTAWEGSGNSPDANSYMPVYAGWGWYCDYRAAPYGLNVKIFKNWAADVIGFEVPPNTEIRAQASVWVAHLSGDANEQDKRELTLRAEIVTPGGYVQYLTFATTLAPTGNGGWVAYATTTNWTTPAGDKPTYVYLRHFWVGYDGGGLAAPPNPPTMRLHVDWARLIGPDGNPLRKKTADAIHGIKAWNGSAWV